MNFRTSFNRTFKRPSPSGDRYRQKYVKTVNADGTCKLFEDGVEDVYDSIQKASNGRLLEDLIRRTERGDASAIGSPVDSYVDITNAPKDLLEAHTMLSDARVKYDKLPAELRAKFGNSFESFLKASSDGTALKALTEKPKSTTPPLSPEEISKLRASLGGKKDE